MADKGPLEEETKGRACPRKHTNCFNLNTRLDQQKTSHLFPANACSPLDITSLLTAHFIRLSNFGGQSYPSFGEHLSHQGDENTF